MKPCWDHRFVVLPLSKVTTQTAIAGVCDKHNWIRAVVIDGLANRVILRQSLDVAEGFVVFWEPIEFNTFASQIREDGGPFRKDS